jgi:CO/xanthine dehydrogenase FAD-binding subunit
VRALVPTYSLERPRTLAEALRLLDSEPGAWKPLAGGTDLMVAFEAGRLAHRRLFSIWGLSELKGIEATSDRVSLGALTTYTEARLHPVLQAEFPMLCQAGAETGAIAIQNRGTLGGNIVNASPAADSPPALLVYEAELELVSSKGSRRVPYGSFHLGYKRVDLRPDELLHRIHLKRAPASARRIHHYRKVGTRRAQAISKTCIAALAELDSSGAIAAARIGLGSVAPTPIRCPRTEAALTGRKPSPALVPAARAAIRSEIAPIDDIRSTAEYRARVTENLLEEFLLKLCGTG